MKITAAPHWQTVDFISDLHLQAGEPQTFQALSAYLASTPAQALFILGDLFEVWVGDDVLQTAGFEAAVARQLHATSTRLDIFIMSGNRDFLMGDRLMAACGAKPLEDPSVLDWGNTRWLLAHGDAQCLGDVPYQTFRSQVRSHAWQQQFLNKPLAERQSVARQMRAQSESQKRQHSAMDVPWIDLDTQACRAVLATHHADHMVHGHTHQPAQHDLGQGHVRWVLSDWDMRGTPQRAQV
ncbi:MAG: UDP-2,3-diacylglucosamine diphosphatase, partial [Rhodoferax sp.]